MQVLIVGCSGLVQHVVLTLIKENQQVTILDEHQSCPNRDHYCREAVTVPSTGVLMEDLQRCDVDNTDIFLALSEDDNQNAMAAQIASHIFNVPKVICHIANPSKYNVYRSMGLNVVSSTSVISENILQDLKGLR